MKHPINDRYNVPELDRYLGDEALLSYMLRVEAAYAQALADVGVISRPVADEVESAAKSGKITYEAWLDRERNVTRHDIRAMVQLIQEQVSENTKPYVHLALTSEDAKGTARSLMLRDATYNVILPDSIALETTLVDLSRRYMSTAQIGRTHGQHAEPTTFGRELAVYVDRFGEGIERIYHSAKNLRGKTRGAVGTQASFMLFYRDPEKLEELVMERLGIEPARITTQILHPESEADLLLRILLTFGTLNDLANDMRHLQRQEIGEVYEAFGPGQVGSSTMPHKRNPVSFENVCGQYREMLGESVSVLANIESEHQRDMRNSAPQRYHVPEIIGAFVYSVRNMNRLISSIEVNEDAMQRNLDLTRGAFYAEPAYIALALAGDPDAHEHMKKLTARKGAPFSDITASDETLRSAIERIPLPARRVFEKPEFYTGKSEEQVIRVTKYWTDRLQELMRTL